MAKHTQLCRVDFARRKRERYLPKRYRFPGHVAIPTSIPSEGRVGARGQRRFPSLHVEVKSSFPEAERKCPAWQRTKSPSFCPVVYFFSSSSCKATPASPRRNLLQPRRFTVHTPPRPARPAAVSGPIRGRAGTGEGHATGSPPTFPHGLNFRASLSSGSFSHGALNQTTQYDAILGQRPRNQSREGHVRVTTNNTRRRYTPHPSGGSQRPPLTSAVQCGHRCHRDVGGWTGMGKLGYARWRF